MRKLAKEGNHRYAVFSSLTNVIRGHNTHFGKYKVWRHFAKTLFGSGSMSDFVHMFARLSSSLSFPFIDFVHKFS